MVYHFIHPVGEKNSIFVLSESERYRGRSEADDRNIAVCFPPPSLSLTIPFLLLWMLLTMFKIFLTAWLGW